jgi:hypothetical protein
MRIAALPAAHQPVRLLLVAVAVGCRAAVVPDVRVTLALATEGLWNLVVPGLATGLGVGQRWIRAVRADVDLDAGLRNLIDEAESDADGEGRAR